MNTPLIKLGDGNDGYVFCNQLETNYLTISVCIYMMKYTMLVPNLYFRSISSFYIFENLNFYFMNAASFRILSIKIPDMMLSIQTKVRHYDA